VTTRNGNLQQAAALLMEHQTVLMQNQVLLIAEHIKAILIRHEHILNALPEAIRQKIGFKAK